MTTMSSPIAPVISLPASTSARSSSKKPHGIRRRGRARRDVESDDEIERVLSTDDESDDDHSSVDSDSETESDSDDVRQNRRSEVVTPSTTQSPPPPELDGRNGLAEGMQSKPEAVPFATSSDWAEMVTAEHGSGVEDLPVIDFSELGAQSIDQQVVTAPRSRRMNREPPPHRSTSAPPTSPPRRVTQLEEAAAEFEQQEHAVSASVSIRGRARTQSARQAYQQRLESDPSFVPKVGEFWGHDDRLLDKDLRSLSGWWRGRWQSRARGRSFGIRGRGRGFHNGGAVHIAGDNAEGEPDSVAAEAEVPPVEKAWTHDGFEEMKRRDERRREQQKQRQEVQEPRAVSQRGTAFRGRADFFNPRGRGAFARGTASPMGVRQGKPASIPAGRPWFAMKPEPLWTKQLDAPLFWEISLKPRPGVGPGFRIKFPGGPEHIIRGPPRSYPISRVGFEPVPIDDGEKAFVVRLPCSRGKEKATEQLVSPEVQGFAVKESATTVAELSIEEVFTVRPNLVPNKRPEIPSKTPTIESGLQISSSATPPPPSIEPSSGTKTEVTPEAAASVTVVAETPAISAVKNPLELLSLKSSVVRPRSASPSAQLKETVLRRPSLTAPPLTQVSSEEPQRPAPPTLPPLQTTFSPVPQTSPQFGSPYAYAPPLPPGIGMDQHGMTYEIATGRPVFLHQQAPPPMFTPRPMMHAHAPHPSTGMPFVPGHMNHHSASSPDFLSQPHTPSVGSFVDPSTGVPVFVPARQSSRIEIRAPVDATDGRKSFSRPSGLRTAVSSAEAHQRNVLAEHTGDLSGANGAAPVDQPPAQFLEQGMAYPAYQQQYYYPEPYAYGSYMDMPPQAMHYEMYSADHHPSQPPMIYY